ncbi:MAG: TatD family hydrolase [Oscillibacter sp.]|nr:TatD family hydrolase [Oscillibacter sp.]
MRIFDTHAHYDDGRFDADRDEVLRAARSAGVERVVVPGCDLASSRAALALAEAYPFVYAAVGVHPEDCADFSDATVAELEALARHEKAVAIGEIGLDYYWKENPPKEFQQEVFRRQLELARRLSLPVIVHDREAHGDCLALVSEFPDVTGVFHCFSGSAEMAAELVKRGWYLGFDGPVTYKNARRAGEVLAAVPTERIVVETDAPYLSPEPLRGRRNDSRNLTYVLETLAAFKGISAAEMAERTFENGKRLYRME